MVQAEHKAEADVSFDEAYESFKGKLTDTYGRIALGAQLGLGMPEEWASKSGPAITSLAIDKLSEMGVDPVLGLTGSVTQCLMEALVELGHVTVSPEGNHGTD